MNIVLIVIDSLRKDAVSAYGPTVGREWFGRDIETPNLSKFSEAALRFTSAYPEALPTVPYRRAINTGRRVFPFNNYRPPKWDIVYTPGWQPISEDVDTLSEVLARSGYLTSYISDCMPVFQPSMNFHRGFHQWNYVRGQQNDRWQSMSRIPEEECRRHFVSDRHYAQTGWIVKQHLANTLGRTREEEYFAPTVFQLADKWLEENADAEQFFLMIDCWDPHEPWDPPQSYIDMYDPGYVGVPLIHPMYTLEPWCSDAEMKQLRAKYSGEVTMVDRWLGWFLDSLARRGLSEDTAVVVISDHGHALNDRGVTGKMGVAQHPELVDLVLMMRHPDGRGAGQSADTFVYNIDVVATLAGWAGVELECDGVELDPVFHDPAVEVRAHVTGAMGRWATYRDRRHKLIQAFEGLDKPENSRLFDLLTDPNEMSPITDPDMKLVQTLYDKILEDAGGELPMYDVPLTFADGSRPPA